MIGELYVPRGRLADFISACADDFRRNAVDTVYGTVRLSNRDAETYLAWAREDYSWVVFNLHTVHTSSGIARSAASFRRLVDLAIDRRGSYFLTYHRFATREQLETCYPQFLDFLRLKHFHDPDGLFQSDWYRHYVRLFHDDL